VTAQLVADRFRGLETSPTLALVAKAAALRQAGKPLIDFSAGEPDFPTPEAIKRAAVKAIEENRTKYTPVAGVAELRAAIATQLTHRLGVAYEPSRVIVSCGAKQALYNALQVICQPGDEVMVFKPYWVSYPPLVQLAGAKAVVIETREAERFQPDPDAVEEALTEATKVLILNSPANPTGMLIERQRLEQLAQIALEHELVVLSDEIYDQLVFPPHKAVSIVQVEPRLASHAVVVNGVSKTYSMTGWRIGYAAGPQALIEAMVAFQSHSTSNPTSISQYAALAAITGHHQEVETMVKEFQQRRDALVNGLNQLPGLSCPIPEGAFYAWCNISQLGQSAATIAARWLDDALVAVVPGEGFGSNDHVRLSFATSRAMIEEGLTRLTRWLRNFAPQNF